MNPTEGLLIGDKIYFISLICQRFAEFCCNNTATTIGWVTNNSDFHAVKLVTYLIQLSADLFAKQKIILQNPLNTHLPAHYGPPFISITHNL